MYLTIHPPIHTCGGVICTFRFLWPVVHSSYPRGNCKLVVVVRVRRGYSAATALHGSSCWSSCSVPSQLLPTCSSRNSTVLYETYVAGHRNLDVDVYINSLQNTEKSRVSTFKSWHCDLCLSISQFYSWNVTISSIYADIHSLQSVNQNIPSNNANTFVHCWPMKIEIVSFSRQKMLSAVSDTLHICIHS